MQLGQTDDPKKLIHGSPSKLRSTARHLDDFKSAFERVAGGLKGMDSAELKGEAANTFREKVAIEPPRWFTASDACDEAAKALRDFAGTVEWAQGQAKDAIDKYNKGKHESEAYQTKIDSYNSAVDRYNAQPAADRDPDSLPEKPEKTDPGAAEITAARELLAEARRQRNNAEVTAVTKVKAARDDAPAEPTYAEQVQDGVVGMQLNASHFFGGVIKGSAGVLNFVRAVNPTDPYNLTHPAEYFTNLNSTAAGLVRTLNNPAGTLQNMWEGFQQDPAEGFGRLVPELLGTRGLGSIKTAARVARHAPEGPPAPHDWSDLAQPTPQVSQPAIHADSVPAARADEFIDDQYPWLREVNNDLHVPGYNQNCSHNVVTVDRRLDGVEVSAAPKHVPGHVDPTMIGRPDLAPGQMYPVSSYDELIQNMEARGDGARSVVFIARPDGSAHVFNVINTEHGVVFLDGQTGQLGRLEGNVTNISHIPYR